MNTTNVVSDKITNGKTTVLDRHIHTLTSIRMVGTAKSIAKYRRLYGS